jgi:D-lyxose ketol-isomerase
MPEEATMEPDETTELGEDEPITDENYRDGWDSVATNVGNFDENGLPIFTVDAVTEEGLPARPTKTLSDDR